MTLRLISALGLVAIVFIAWLMSSSKKQVPWRVIFAGIALQLVLAVLTLKTTAGQWLFSRANELVGKLMSFVDQGTSFLVTIRWPPGAPVEPVTN